MDLRQYMDERRVLVEGALDRLLPSINEPPSRLHEAMRYTVLAPGKRLRPILVLASAEALGGRAETVLPAACALECIHAFSLIHDDLPCMDNDDLRRGRPTNHKVYGEAMALLAGDALLALAFELLALQAENCPLPSVVEAVRMVARASGTHGMVGGQVADMQAQGRDVGIEELRFIHSHKTGSLLTASACLGALLFGANKQQFGCLELYGHHLGLAFQIGDDILDVVGEESRIGKPVGSDLRQDKATYPKLFGLERSRAMAREQAEAAVQALSPLGTSADPLRALAYYVVDRDL